MDAGQQLFAAIFGSGAILGVALVSGIKSWRSTGGKIVAVTSGVLLVGLIAVVAFIVLMAIILPAVIALP